MGSMDDTIFVGLGHGVSPAYYLERTADSHFGVTKSAVRLTIEKRRVSCHTAPAKSVVLSAHAISMPYRPPEGSSG
jgi:hypothetical protein